MHHGSILSFKDLDIGIPTSFGMYEFRAFDGTNDMAGVNIFHIHRAMWE